MLEDLNASLRQIVLDNNIHHSTVLANLKNETSHLHKDVLVQELLENDFARRIQFCEIMMKKKMYPMF